MINFGKEMKHQNIEGSTKDDPRDVLRTQSNIYNVYFCESS